MKKLLSLLLALIMCVSLFPVSVLADDEELPDEPVVTEPAPEEEPVVEEPAPEETEPPAEEPPAEPEAEPASEEELPPEIEAAALIDGNVITEENFPDAAFRSYLLGLYPEGATANTLADVSVLNVSDMGISDLTGINYFANLYILNCSGNRLTRLNVTRLESLYELNCSRNRLTELVLMEEVHDDLQDYDYILAPYDLAYLDCSDNMLESLDFTDCYFEFYSLNADRNCLSRFNIGGSSITFASFEDQKLSPTIDAYNIGEGNYLACLEAGDVYNPENDNNDYFAGIVLLADGDPALQEIDEMSSMGIPVFAAINDALSSGMSVKELLGSATGVPVPVGDGYGGCYHYMRFSNINNVKVRLYYYNTSFGYSSSQAFFCITYPINIEAYDDWMYLRVKNGGSYVYTDSIIAAPDEEVEVQLAVSDEIEFILRRVMGGAPDCRRPGNAVVVSQESDATGMLGKFKVFHGPKTGGISAEVQLFWYYINFDGKRVELPAKTLRVDFAKSGELAGEVLTARALESKLSVEYFRTEYPELPVIIELEHLGASASGAGDVFIPETANTGWSVLSAEFEDETAKEYFNLKVKDDHTLTVVPDPDRVYLAYNDAGALAGIPESVTSTVKLTLKGRGDALVTQNPVTINISKAPAPKITAEPLKFNSLVGAFSIDIPEGADFYDINSLLAESPFGQEIKFKGGKVIEVKYVDHDTQLTEGLCSDSTGYKRIIHILYNGVPGAKVKGTLTAHVQLEGWAVLVPVTVSYSAAPVQPKVKFSGKSFNLTADDGSVVFPDILPVEYEISSPEFCGSSFPAKITAEEKGVPFEDISIENEYNGDGTGRLLIFAGHAGSLKTCSNIFPIDDGKDHTVKVNMDFGAGCKPVSFTVKIKSVRKSQKAASQYVLKKSGGIDLAVLSSCLKLQLAGKNLNSYTLDLVTSCFDETAGGFITAEIWNSKGQKVASYHYNSNYPSDMFQIYFDESTRTFSVYALYKRSVDKDETYTFKVTALGDAIATADFTVKETKAKPSATLKVKGSYNAATGEFPAFYISGKNIGNLPFGGFFDISQDAALMFVKSYDGATGMKLAEPEMYVAYYIPNSKNNSMELLPDGGIRPTHIRGYDEETGEDYIYTIHPKDKFTVYARVFVEGMYMDDDGIEVASKSVKLGISTAVPKYKPSQTYTICGTDCFSSFIVGGIDLGGANITKVELDAASAKLFEAGNAKSSYDGAVKIEWKSRLLPMGGTADLIGKTKTITVNVWTNGLEQTGAKANLTFKVKVKIV